MLSRESVLSALHQVTDPASGRDVVSAGMISGVAVKGDKVGFILTIAPQEKENGAALRERCESAVKHLPGVSAVTAVLTAQNPEPIAPKPEAGYAAPRERAQWNLTPVENVSHVVAIASGKGGVGKSTVSVNLARALTLQGKLAGLLDADIYGPSIPRMMGLFGQPPIREGKMVPLESEGIACMSMGFITGDEAAILRGPMISKTLHQLLRMTHWGRAEQPLDVLLVDMPPGTGDIHLSMAQQVPLSGAVIVTTPQDVALADARKCAAMFRKVNVPILGVIENMSFFEDASGARHTLFGAGGGKKLAKEFDVPLLGEIPLMPAVREAADEGKAAPLSCLGAYQHIAEVLTQLKQA